MGEFPYECPECGGANKRCARPHICNRDNDKDGCARCRSCKYCKKENCTTCRECQTNGHILCSGDQFCWENEVVAFVVNKNDYNLPSYFEYHPKMIKKIEEIGFTYDKILRKAFVGYYDGQGRAVIEKYPDVYFMEYKYADKYSIPVYIYCKSCIYPTENTYT